MESIGLSLFIYFGILCVCYFIGSAIGKFGKIHGVTIGSISTGFFFIIGIVSIITLFDSLVGLNLFVFLPLIIGVIFIFALFWDLTHIEKLSKSRFCILFGVIVVSLVLF